MRTSTGSAYFDGIQLEEYSVPNGYNFLSNSGFEEIGSNGLPDDWVDEYSNLTISTDKVTSSYKYSGSNSFGFKGSFEYCKGIKQTVNVSG